MIERKKLFVFSQAIILIFSNSIECPYKYWYNVDIDLE